jgi:glutathione synthase/RimK-type ligase-like ATP-grasp enzyme
VLDSQRSAIALAAELDVPVPRTVTFDSQEDFENALEEVPVTGIIKALISHGSRGVALYKRKDQLRRQPNRLGIQRALDDPLPLIQEDLDARTYATTMLAHQGQVIAYFVRRNIRKKEQFGGACIKCESVHCPELLEYSSRIVRHCNTPA